jgi:hypothetical protein
VQLPSDAGPLLDGGTPRPLFLLGQPEARLLGLGLGALGGVLGRLPPAPADQKEGRHCRGAGDGYRDDVDDVGPDSSVRHYPAQRAEQRPEKGEAESEPAQPSFPPTRDAVDQDRHHDQAEGRFRQHDQMRGRSDQADRQGQRRQATAKRQRQTQQAPDEQGGRGGLEGQIGPHGEEGQHRSQGKVGRPPAVVNRRTPLGGHNRVSLDRAGHRDIGLWSETQPGRPSMVEG